MILIDGHYYILDEKTSFTKDYIRYLTLNYQKNIRNVGMIKETINNLKRMISHIIFPQLI